LYTTYKTILNAISNQGFEKTALEVFKYQFTHNPIYNQWCISLGKTEPKNLQEIPFLPVSFFKTHKVITGNIAATHVFKSSGTTSTTISSQHFVSNIQLYNQAVEHGFTNAFGAINNYCILGLLPNYLERGHSSLVHMVNHLLGLSNNPQSGFYLNNFNALANTLNSLQQQNKKIWLIGVTYALINFFEQYPMQLKNTIILETGGMKGKQKEMIRAEVHENIKANTGLAYINGEYGMTELLSHAYLNNQGYFEPIPTMQVLVRQDTDPLHINTTGKGLLNIVDLANINSCSFIAVDDYGNILPNGHFMVNGRVDNSDIRGCSLMYNAL
jgi:hypothetical protein